MGRHQPAQHRAADPLHRALPRQGEERLQGQHQGDRQPMGIGRAEVQRQHQRRPRHHGGPQRMAERGGGPGQVRPQRHQQPRPPSRPARVRRGLCQHPGRGGQQQRDPHARDHARGDAGQGAGAEERHLAQHPFQDGALGRVVGRVVLPGLVGDGGQQQADQAQLPRGGGACRGTGRFQHVRQGDQRTEQLVRGLHLDQGLPGARACGAASAYGVQQQGARGLDPVADVAAMGAGVVGPGMGGRGVGGGQGGQVPGQRAEPAIHLGDRAPGRAVGVQAPDQHGQHQRPQAAAHESQSQHRGGLQVLAPVQRQDGDDGQQVADLQRRLAPHAGKAGAEDHQAGQRHHRQQPIRPQHAEPGGQQPAQHRERQQRRHPAPHRAARVAQAGQQGGKRGLVQLRDAQPFVRCDQHGNGQGGAHALCDGQCPQIETDRQMSEISIRPTAPTCKYQNNACCPLSLRERAGVREAASTVPSQCKQEARSGWCSPCRLSLTPTLSRREREQQASSTAPRG